MEFDLIVVGYINARFIQNTDGKFIFTFTHVCLFTNVYRTDSVTLRELTILHNAQFLHLQRCTVIRLDRRVTHKHQSAFNHFDSSRNDRDHVILCGILAGRISYCENGGIRSYSNLAKLCREFCIQGFAGSNSSRYEFPLVAIKLFTVIRFNSTLRIHRNSGGRYAQCSVNVFYIVVCAHVFTGLSFNRHSKRIRYFSRSYKATWNVCGHALTFCYIAFNDTNVIICKRRSVINSLNRSRFTRDRTL